MNGWISTHYATQKSEAVHSGAVACMTDQNIQPLHLQFEAAIHSLDIAQLETGRREEFLQDLVNRLEVTHIEMTSIFLCETPDIPLPVSPLEGSNPLRQPCTDPDFLWVWHCDTVMFFNIPSEAKPLLDLGHSPVHFFAASQEGLLI